MEISFGRQRISSAGQLGSTAEVPARRARFRAHDAPSPRRGGMTAATEHGRPLSRGSRPMISGKTRLIAHLGYPTESFKAPLIYNPYFDEAGIDAVVVPMGVKAED